MHLCSARGTKRTGFPRQPYSKSKGGLQQRIGVPVTGGHTQNTSFSWNSESFPSTTIWQCTGNRTNTGKHSPLLFEFGIARALQSGSKALCSADKDKEPIDSTKVSLGCGVTKGVITAENK